MIDFKNLPVDTKLIVRDNDKQEWINRHFALVINNDIYCYFNGLTSWSCSDNYVKKWAYAEPANGEQQINNIEHLDLKINGVIENIGELTRALTESNADFDNIDKKRFIEIDNEVCEL